MPTLKDKVSQLSTELKNVKTDVRKLENLKKEPLVYFAAYLSSDKSFCAVSKITFDQVEANEGGGYNPATGVFTAPVTGVYLFTFVTEAGGKDWADFSISNSGDLKSLMTLTAFPNSRSMDVILHVKTNHQVYVEMVWAQHKCSKIRAQKFTKFSGTLLHTE